MSKGKKVDQGKFGLWLSQRWTQDRRCPTCGDSKWIISRDVAQISSLVEGGTVIGGSAVPVVPVACGNCGYTILFNAIVAGLIEKSGESKETGE